MTNNTEHEPQLIARRTVLKGAAWSTPVVLAATHGALAAATNGDIAEINALPAPFQLSGSRIGANGVTSNLRLNNTLQFTTSGDPAAGAQFTYTVLMATLVMNDGQTWDITPGLQRTGALNGTHQLPQLDFSAVRILNQALNPQLYKHLRYPVSVSTTLGISGPSVGSYQSKTLTWQLPSKATQVRNGNNPEITYWGNATVPSAARFGLNLVAPHQSTGRDASD